jgi:hypothetical protein
MSDVVESKQARPPEVGEQRRRPWVRPHLETADADATEKVPKFGPGTDGAGSLS